MRRPLLKIILVATILAVAVAIVAAMLTSQKRPKLSSPAALQDLVRTEAPVPDRERARNYPRLADQNPEFRRWLVNVIMKPDPEDYARTEALHLMYEMKDGAASYSMAQELLKRLDAEKPPTNEERRRRVLIRTDLVLIALLADWPVPETFEFIRRVQPESQEWRGIPEAQASVQPGSKSAWSTEHQKKLTERSKAILEYAHSLEATKAPAATPGTKSAP